MRTKVLVAAGALALGALLPALASGAEPSGALGQSASSMSTSAVTAPTVATATTATTSKVDVLARRPDGTLWLYRGSGTGGWLTPYVQVGSGWGGFTALLGPGDFSGDGKVDVLARRPDGTLLLYRGSGTGGWLTPYIDLGGGWGGYTALLGPGDFSGDGKVDVLARDSAGRMWLYAGNGRGGFIWPRVQVGSGWGGFTALITPGDFSGDGKVDVLARKPDGTLWLYRGSGKGGWLSPYLQVGSGWGGFTALVGPGDFSGDGKVDVLARRPDGTLWLYRGSGKGGWLTPYLQVGSGWGGFTALVGPGDFNGDATPPAPPPATDCSKLACVALTFDDGPDTPSSRLVDTLVSHKAPATFFVIGNKISSWTAVVQKENRNGFPVQNHTYSHPDLSTLSLTGQQTEVRRADDAIASVGVRRSSLLRPPYGAWNSSTRALGKPLILWSVDPRDWDGRTASQIRYDVVNNTRSGSIVLMHDRVSATVDAVPGIISDLRARGFTLVTVQTLVPWMEPGDLVYSRSNVVDASVSVTERDGMLVAPDGRVVGPALVDEAPFE